MIRGTVRLVVLGMAALAPLGCISPFIRADHSDDPVLRIAYECDLTVRRNPYLGVAAPGFLVAERFQDECLKARGQQTQRALLFE